MSINDPVNLGDLLRAKLNDPTPSRTTLKMDNINAIKVRVLNVTNTPVDVTFWSDGVVALAKRIREGTANKVDFIRALRNKHRLGLLEAKRVADVFYAVASATYVNPEEMRTFEEQLVNKHTSS